ncbi:hypothetical protein [Neobacillus drentensis]|uniref:hypothetical protein n=1 Tax=Neobacillus drentensis TaxID=220684 RepID=UPI002FFD8879
MNSMHFEDASKRQLLQIALHEDCSIDYKYRAARELQMRWSENLLPDLVRLYAKGMNMSEIAWELGLDPYTVRNKLKQYGIYKRRVGA